MSTEESLTRTRSFRSDVRRAVLALIAVGVMSVIALVEPAVADRLTLENGVVEWLQVILDAGAALLFGRALVRNARTTGASRLSTSPSSPASSA
jgi:ABC-type enterobactin transport system permease subunit